MDTEIRILLFQNILDRGGVELNRTNFELIFIEFFELFFTFRIDRIINFRTESNEFRTNPASENLTPPYRASSSMILLAS